MTREEPINLKAGVDTEVPLWLALNLRTKGMCQIIPPDWMLDVDLLQTILDFERDPNEQSFNRDLPFRHLEIARGILSAISAGSGTAQTQVTNTNLGGGGIEIQNIEQVRLLLEDIHTVRADKIRRNIHTISSQVLSKEVGHVPIIDITGIGAMELLSVRPFLSRAFQDHGKIAIPPRKSDDNSNARNRNMRRGEGSSRPDPQSTEDADEGDDDAMMSQDIPSQPASGSRIRRFRN